MYPASSMRIAAPGYPSQPMEAAGERRSLNSELWHACAGPLVALPPVGSAVVYFPQGHTEQVAASTQKETDVHALNYPNPNLPSCLTCQLHNVTLHADTETDEVYAQMTLQPVSGMQEKEPPLLMPHLGKPSRQPTDFFCKTLTASDTSTHGGFSIPRKSAEKVFPPLDYNQAPPAQELVARDLHDQEWRFRHIYRGQPRRHLLTTGWSVFVSAKRLQAGDAVLFIRDEKGQLLLGIRRANRQQTPMPSSVLSSDSMHIGVLGAAAHAAATSSRFTIFYNPRASPSEFVIPFAKYHKAAHDMQLSVGMRFRMVFETEESSVRRHMGTITGIGDLDPVRWPNSMWRALKVGWDESTAGERQPRVSAWEIEPLTTPFIICPPPQTLPLRTKRSRPSRGQGHPAINEEDDVDGILKRSPPWLRSEEGDREGLQTFRVGVDHWMRMHQRGEAVAAPLSDNYKALAASALQDTIAASKQMIPRQSAQTLQPAQLHYRVQHQLALQPQQLQQQQQLHQQPQQLHQQPQQQLQQLSDATVPLLQLSSSRPQSPIALQTMRTNAGFCDSDLQLSSASSGPFPLSGMLGRSQTATLLPGDDNGQYASILRSTQNPMQQGSGLSSVSGIVSRDAQVNSCWFAPIREHNQGEAPVISGRISRVDTSSGGVDPFSISQGESSAPAGLAALPIVTSPAFGYRDSPQDQEQVQSDTRSRLLFGVSIESPLLGSSAGPSLPSRGYGKESQHRFSGGALMGGTYASTSGADLPLPAGLLSSGGIDDSGLLQRSSNWSQVPTPMRTFTKVVKLGSVGRSLDITRFSGYPELRSELGRMFGMEGQLEDPTRSGWQLVFVDNEGDILLVGDDPWEEFVSCVRYIRILSPPEVQHMSQEGLDLLTPVPPMPRQTSSSSEDCAGRPDARNSSVSAPPSAGSMEH